MPTLEEWLGKTYGSDLSKVTEIKDVPRDVTGKFFFLLADQSAFSVEYSIFFRVTDSALFTLYSTSLPRGLMVFSPFLLVTATPQATSRCSRTARN